MLETATALMQQGFTPSVTAVAEAAEVSRATAYRYFPTQADLVQAVVDEALGPILDWAPAAPDAESRVDDLLAQSLPRIEEFEATFRAALRLSLEQWATLEPVEGAEPPFGLGHRTAQLQEALAPLKKTLPRKQLQRLAMALSLTGGLETLVVLKDLWGAESREATDVARWAAQALIRAAVTEAAQKRRQLERARAKRGA
jgi:AcrR family transcriptional regulator